MFLSLLQRYVKYFYSTKKSGLQIIFPTTAQVTEQDTAQVTAQDTAQVTAQDTEQVWKRNYPRKNFSHYSGKVRNHSKGAGL